MKRIIMAVAAMATITTGFAQKKLVLYYSETGTTKAVAEELQKQLGADIECIEAVTPYSGDFQATIQRSQRERENGETPALKPLKKKIAEYDVIFLGYPIWFGTYAMPIATLVKENDFAGKTIVPFCTFGSGGLNTSTNDLKKALPQATPHCPTIQLNSPSPMPTKLFSMPPAPTISSPWALPSPLANVRLPMAPIINSP